MNSSMVVDRESKEADEAMRRPGGNKQWSRRQRRSDGQTCGAGKGWRSVEESLTGRCGTRRPSAIWRRTDQERYKPAAPRLSCLAMAISPAWNSGSSLSTRPLPQKLPAKAFRIYPLHLDIGGTMLLAPDSERGGSS